MKPTAPWPPDAAVSAPAPPSAAAELERLRADVQRLTASVSHDLRAPLRHIIAFAGLAREDLAEGQLDAVGQHLLQVEASAQLLGQLIDALTQYGRLATLALNTLPLDLATLVAEAQALASAATGARAVQWQLPDDWPGVVADPVLLRQVWQQLFDNALKFTRSRALAELRLDWQRLSATELAFRLHDNGVGFRAPLAAQLFEVFVRLHSATEYPGCGIGLARCRRIIERHGGRIWAEAEPERGCTIVFTLPG